MAYAAPWATLPAETPPWHSPERHWKPGTRFGRSRSDVTLDSPCPSGHKGISSHFSHLETERLIRRKYHMRLAGVGGAMGESDRASSAGRSSSSLQEPVRSGLTPALGKQATTALGKKLKGVGGTELARAATDRGNNHGEWNVAAPHPGGKPSKHSRSVGPGGGPFATSWSTPELSTTFSLTRSTYGHTKLNPHLGHDAWIEPSQSMCLMRRTF